MKHRSAQLAWLQVVRACAALMVVGYHASGRLASLYKTEDFLWFNVFFHGNVGVQLFFVISGFIIAHIHAKDIGQPGQFAPYVYKRLTRIYPLYWVLFILVVPLYFVFPASGESYHKEPLNIIGSFFLFPVPPKQLIGPAWSLVPEIIFYALFSLMIIGGKAGKVLFISWAILVAYNAVFGLNITNYSVRSFFSFHFVGFFVGVGVAFFPWFRGKLVPPVLGLALATLLFLLLPYLLDTVFGEDAFWNRMIVFLAAGIVVLGALSLDYAEREAPAVLVELGNATYSIYLYHWLVGWILEKGLKRLSISTALPIDVAFFVLVLLMLTGGFGVYLLIEKPLMKLTRSIYVRNASST